MSKLTEAKMAENDTIAGRSALLLNAVVDDLDALAASVNDEDAKAKIYALADDYESTKPRVISSFIVGTPGQPPAEPPKPVAYVAPSVSQEAADHTAAAAIAANGRKRAERPDAKAGSVGVDNRAQWKKQDDERKRLEGAAA